MRGIRGWTPGVGAGLLMCAVCVPQAEAMHASQGAELQLAETRGFSVSARACVGMLQGEAREVVYDGDYQLSELNWDLSGLAMGGAALSAGFSKWFRVQAGFWTALNKGDGEMTDYDWLIRGMPWSDYSRSDVDVEAACLLDVNAQFRLFGWRDLAVYGMAGYKYNFWEWSDYGREYIYSIYGFRDTTGNFRGENGIDYEQTFHVPYAGITAATVGHRWRLSAYFLWTPFVTAGDEDHHMIRDLRYTGSFENGLFAAFGCELVCELTKNLFVAASMDWQKFDEIVGDTTVANDDGSFTATFWDGAGVESETRMFSASFGVEF